MAPPFRLLVSACLMGQEVRYDARAKARATDALIRLKDAGRLVVFCPEVAGGLPIPRLPAEIEPGLDGSDVLAGRARVIDAKGGDVTKAFVEGARKAVAFALSERCTHAMLTERSPSCGSSLLYSGHHNGQTRVGFGVTTAALRAAGVTVVAPDDWSKLPQLHDVTSS